MKKRARKDTTVKLDGLLVEEVAGQLNPGETLTGYVRDAVRYRLRQKQMRKAAEVYRTVLESDARLAEEMKTWEEADLAKPPETGDGKALK